MTLKILLTCMCLATCSLGNGPGAPADPRLADITPDGVQRGTEATIELRGSRLKGPLELVTYDPGITVLSLEEKGKSKVIARIRVAADAPLGEHRLRLRTRSGWTELRTLWVGALPCLKEEENNNRFHEPQVIPFGVTVHGRVLTEDVDHFRIEARKGQRITAEVEGIRLGNTLFDPYVAILDERRFELASADDTALLRQDAFASTVAPEDGHYVVVVRESAYGGSSSCRYRLHVGDMPRPTAVYPAGGKPGAEIKLTWLGDPMGPVEEVRRLPKRGGTHKLHMSTADTVAPSANLVRISNIASALEQEPNNDRKEATPAAGALPCAFDGVIGEDGDRDWFSFEAKKGQDLNVAVHARLLGSPLDPSLLVIDPKGKSVLSNDDGLGLDSRGRFRAAESGTYRLRVRDHLNRGAADKVYRVEIRPVFPGLSLVRPPVRRNDSQSQQWASVPRGNRAYLMLRVNRRDFSGEVDLTCGPLPPGVTMHAPRVRGETSNVPVVFEAAADAPLEGALCDLQGFNTKNKKYRGRFQQRVDLVTGNPNNAPYYWTTVRKFPVCVTEEAPFKVNVVAPTVPLIRDGRMRLKVQIERAEGFDEAVRLTMPFRPPGVSAARTVDVPKGSSEALYLINAAANAATGEWKLAVQASAQVKGGGRVYLASPLFDLHVSPHLFTGAIPLTVTTQGEATDVICKLSPVTAFEGEGVLRLNGLPAQVTAPTMKVTKDTKEVVFPIKTTAKSPAGQHKSLFCSLVVDRGGESMQQSLAGGGVLRIDKPRAKPKPKPKKVVAAKKPKPAPKAKPKKRLTRLEQLRLEAAERAKAGQATTGGGGER